MILIDARTSCTLYTTEAHAFIFFGVRFLLFDFFCCHSRHQDGIKFTGQVNICNIYFSLILTAFMKRTEILVL
jgi:hypothetical protein